MCTQLEGQVHDLQIDSYGTGDYSIGFACFFLAFSRTELFRPGVRFGVPNIDCQKISEEIFLDISPLSLVGSNERRSPGLRWIIVSSGRNLHAGHTWEGDKMNPQRLEEKGFFLLLM